MNFAYSTNAFVRYTLPGALEAIHTLGFAGVEIMCDRPHLYPPDFDPARVEEVRARLKTRRLKVTNLNSFTLFAVGDTYLPSWIEPEPERRRIRIEHTKACLHLAKALDCGCISIPPGGPLNTSSRSQAMSLFYQGLEQVIPVAESLDIRLLVEPEPNLLIERTSEFKAFIREVRSAHVGINFDIGHFYCAGEEPQAAFEELVAWVGHVHLEDIGKSRIHQHLVPGDGAVDFKGIFQTMKKLDYRGDISLELYPYVNEPKAAGRVSLEHLRPLFAEAGLDII